MGPSPSKLSDVSTVLFGNDDIVTINATLEECVYNSECKLQHDIDHCKKYSHPGRDDLKKKIVNHPLHKKALMGKSEHEKTAYIQSQGALATTVDKLVKLFEKAVDPMPFKLILVPLKTNFFVKPMATFMAGDSPFGYVHVGLQIGGLIVDWNDSSLVIPRVWQSDAMAALDIRSAASLNISKNTTIQAVCQLIAEWNGTKKYNYKTCNCQHFVEAIMDKVLGQNRKNFWSEPIQRYLDDVKNGVLTDTPHVYINENGKEKLIKFHNHKELDDWIFNVEEKKEGYRHIAYRDYLPLLKAFDRGFWLKDVKAGTVQPTYRKCPFGDPSINTSSKIDLGSSLLSQNSDVSLTDFFDGSSVSTVNN